MINNNHIERTLAYKSATLLEKEEIEQIVGGGMHVESTKKLTGSPCTIDIVLDIVFD